MGFRLWLAERFMDKETKEALKTIRNFNLEPTKEMKLPTNRKEMILSLKDNPSRTHPGRRRRSPNPNRKRNQPKKA